MQGDAPFYPLLRLEVSDFDPWQSRQERAFFLDRTGSRSGLLQPAVDQFCNIQHSSNAFYRALPSQWIEVLFGISLQVSLYCRPLKLKSGLVEHISHKSIFTRLTRPHQADVRRVRYLPTTTTPTAERVQAYIMHGAALTSTSPRV